MEKKGQLTMFMILGMVFILIFGVVFFVQSYESQKYLEQIGESELIENSPKAFISYLDSCIEDKLEFTADRMLKQGGYIDPFVKNVSFEGDFLSYGVIDDTYPPYVVPKNIKFGQRLVTENLIDGTIGLFIVDKETPYFGRELLPALCDRFGRNTLNLNDTFSCLPELYGSNNQTFQRVLEKELALQIQQCYTNPQLNQIFDFEVSNLDKLTISLAEEEVIVELGSKIEFSDNTNTLSDLYFRYPLRIKKLFNAGYYLANEEIHNIFYDKENNYSSICTKCFEGIEVTVIRDFVSHDDLVILKDKSTRIDSIYRSKLLNDSYLGSISDTPSNFIGNDQYLTMAYLIENRRPYLDPMFNMYVNGDDYSGLVYTDPTNYTLIVHYEDPDEDVVTNSRDVYRAEKDSGSSYNNGPAFDYLENLNENTDYDKGCSVFPSSYGLVNFCDFSGSPTSTLSYDSITYYYNYSISDGQKGDYQEFTIYFDHN